MNSLQQYVADTLEDHLEDYEGDMEAVLDDAMRGTDTGWWNDLIYYTDVRRLFVQHRQGIAEAVLDYEYAVGENPMQHNLTAAHFLLAMSASEDDLRNDDALDMAASWLTRFAVEWETHKYASRNGYEI